MNRLTRILPFTAGVLCTLLLGCAQDVTAPGNLEFAVSRTKPVAFTQCRPTPYAGSSAWIGPKGGRIRAGGHTLFVPAGALKTNTLITMESPAGSINRVSLGPEGLVFDPRYPAHLVMSYDNCAVTQTDPRQQIVHVDEYLTILEMTPSVTDPVALTVDGLLFHFSDYALSTYAVVY